MNMNQIIEAINASTLTEEEAATVARAALAVQQIPATIWLSGDLDEYLEQYDEEDRDRLRQTVLDSGSWQNVADVDEAAWTRVEFAVENAATELGI